MEGCILSSLARVVDTCRWEIYEDGDSWLEIEAFCLGLSNARNLVPLHVMFLGSDLMGTQQIKTPSGQAVSKGKSERAVLEKMKEKVLMELKKDAIIAVSGSVFTEEPIYFIMKPRYQLLPRDFTGEKGSELFMNPERIRQLKQRMEGYSYIDNYLPHS